MSSRFTCVSSWPMTPSSSIGPRRSMRPEVTTRTAESARAPERAGVGHGIVDHHQRGLADAEGRAQPLERVVETGRLLLGQRSRTEDAQRQRGGDPPDHRRHDDQHPDTHGRADRQRDHERHDSPGDRPGHDPGGAHAHAPGAPAVGPRLTGVHPGGGRRLRPGRVGGGQFGRSPGRGPGGRAWRSGPAPRRRPCEPEACAEAPPDRWAVPRPRRRRLDEERDPPDGGGPADEPPAGWRPELCPRDGRERSRPPDPDAGLTG